MQITYNDFNHNQGGNFLGNVPTQLGQIVTTNHNGDPCDVFHNIFEDPLFVNAPGDYHLSWANYPLPDSTMSPCIDAGCPDSLNDPDGTIADMGMYFFDQRYVRPHPHANLDNLVAFHVGPNPFNATAAISYELRAASYVSLKVYDTSGRLVTALVNGFRQAGAHEVTFDGSNLPSGIYLYRIQVGSWSAVGKMALVK